MTRTRVFDVQASNGRPVCFVFTPVNLTLFQGHGCSADVPFVLLSSIGDRTKLSFGNRQAQFTSISYGMFEI